jgi:Protein of unknown function (DUF2442)
MNTSEGRTGASSRLTLSGRARHVSFGEDTLIVDLEDGRQIAVPLAWFPRLVAAGDGQRSKWELVGRGIGIHWPDVDEDISVENLLGVNGELLMDRAVPVEPEPENPFRVLLGPDEGPRPDPPTL